MVGKGVSFTYHKCYQNRETIVNEILAKDILAYHFFILCYKDKIQNPLKMMA